MKRRKGNLFRRLMAMLLVTVLVVGMTQGAVPVRVLAQESVSENAVETGGTQESVGGDAVETGGRQESLSGDAAGISGPQESAYEDEEDIESEDVEEIAEVRMDVAAMSLETVSAVPGTITSDQIWGEQTLPEGNYTINPGVTVTLTGQLTVTGNVTINGGGTIVRDAGYIGETSAGKASLFYMSSGALTLENITVDGNLVESNGPAIYMSGGTVNLQSGAVIQNNKNMNTGGTGRYAGGGIYCGSGILNINGGTIQNCSTREGGSGYSHAGGGIYLKGTCNMTSGSITRNRGSNGGGIYLASAGAELNLTGGTIFGNSAENYGDGIYYSTVYDADSRLLISGNTNVSDIIYLDNTSGSLCPVITSELQHAIYLSCSSREEGRVLAQGSGYTLTDADAGKVSMEDTNLLSKLDGSNNTIVLRVIHTHSVSGSSSTQEVFTALNDNAATLSSGSYYLTGDMALNSPLTVPAGAVVNLCLNGYKLEYSGSEKVSVIVVEQGGTLNLCDCNGSHGSHIFISPVTGQSVTVEGGLVTRSMPVDMVGSGMRVYGTCNFYGGSIAGISDTGRSGSGDIGSSHGAVRVEGVFHMYGGAIAHNRSGCGGGVNICSIGSNDACFYLHGGSIANNYADYDDGGGVCLNGRCSFVMDGGEIRNNRAQSGGGGIECYGNGDSADQVRLTGGTITGNKTGGDVGGGIKCGDAGRPLTVSGSVRITGNTNGSGEESNLYLCNHKTLNIDGGLSGSAMIGVTTESAPTSGNPVSITGNNNADCTAYFISDGSDYIITDGAGHQVQLTYESAENKVTAAKTVVEEALADITADNDTTKQEIQDVIDAALSSAGITDVTVKVGEISKTEATTSAEGSISGTISITYGNASDNVTISKSIDKLPVPDTEKVAAAKTVVEQALESITADNDTTKQEIQDVIDAALSSAGITDVTVKVGEISKTDATTSAEGSISGTIAIACGSANDSVTIRKPIAKLPVSDADKVAAAIGVVNLASIKYTYSNDTTKEDFQKMLDTAFEEAGITDVTVTVVYIGKTEATTSKEGNFYGQVNLQCGDEKKYMSISRPIPKLPVPDTEKVAAAKAVVEQALESITASNDMTRQNIQDVIDAALSSAGITDVTVTVGEISKTDATTSAEGSISGTIAIACGSASDSVTISKPIAKLPVSDAEKIATAKNAVRNALELKFTPSNETTKQEIQAIIDTALNEAGITDVIVTIPYLSKMDATTSEEGWVGARIEFQCGSEKDNLELGLSIDKLPVSGTGEVVKDVQTDGKAPATQLSTPADQLADMILTPEEKQQLTGGMDIKIVLNVKDASESVSGEDKALVEAALNGGNVAEGFVMGQYLDISLFKIIGENRSAISTINGKLNVTIIVPENLRTTDSSITRTFAVIRVHNGGVDLLNDVDNSADTITIETDRFSTYAIVYKDTSNGGGNNNENSGNSGNSNNDGGIIHNNQINENGGYQNENQNGGSSNNGGNADNDNNNNNNNTNNNNNNSNDYTGDQNQKDDEPKTGDNTPLELYATLAMIFGVSNLLFIKKNGFGAMTEEKKKELVARLIKWGKKGGKPRRYAALAVIMVLAVYYHAIGKNIAVEWNENYEG